MFTTLLLFVLFIYYYLMLPIFCFAIDFIKKRKETKTNLCIILAYLHKQISSLHLHHFTKIVLITKLLHTHSTSNNKMLKLKLLIVY